tara:strand:+ start:3377 stop:3694 length:318 start_codon:yes stop_codon:yes gene_type:complete
MIIKGSMNYDQHGRKLKRKGKLRSSSQVRTTACRAVSKGSNPLRSAKRPCSTKEEFLERLKSVSSNSTTKTDWKLEESRKHTVAPAYNKGAYQVIPKNEVKDIGR